MSDRRMYSAPIRQLGRVGSAPGFVLLVLAALAAPATAAKPQASDQGDVSPAEALYAEGAAYFNQGRHREALSRFEAAYKLVPEPNLLFNIARCHEASGDVEQAITYYERCVGDPRTTQFTRQRARQRAKALRDVIAKTQTSGAAAATETAALRTPQASDATSAASATGPAAEPARRSPYWPWAWGTLGVGSALLAASAVLLALGQNDHDELLDQPGYGNSDAILEITRVEASALVDDGNVKKTAGFALLGVGAAAVAASGVLFVLHMLGQAERPELGAGRGSLTRVAVTPVADGVGAVISGRF